MMRKKLRIIAVGAHLDDIEIACGGTIAKAIDRGHIVRMIVLSKSGYSDYAGKQVRTNEQASKEGRKAASILGVDDLRIYDYPAKDVPYDSSIVEVLNAEFDTFRPDVILTHWQYDTHKSHQNTALATFAAGRYYNSILMYEPFAPAGRSYAGFRSQIYVDISQTINKKISAIKAHKSELSKYGIEWVDAVRARAIFRGFELIERSNKGQRFAESFEVLRFNLNIF